MINCYQIINDNDNDDHLNGCKEDGQLTKRQCCRQRERSCSSAIPSLDNLQFANLKSTIIIIRLLLSNYEAPDVLGLSGPRLLAGRPLDRLWSDKEGIAYFSCWTEKLGKTDSKEGQFVFCLFSLTSGFRFSFTFTFGFETPVSKNLISLNFR